MPPKKKGQKVALADFLADETTGGSWADEMESMPTAPAPRDPNLDSSALGGSHLSRGGPGGYGGGGMDRPGGFGSRGGFGDRAGPGRYDSDRPFRAELPVPDKPPFNAFVGNLSFDVTSGDLEAFFDKVSSVRIITDVGGKPKGFGYVEFSEREGLVNALERSGQDLAGRAVRVSVAEAAQRDRGDDRTEGAWRREGPLPPLDDHRRPSGGFSARDPVSDVDRGERMGFGSKFVASQDDGPRGYRRAPGSERAPSYGGFSGANAEEETGARWGLGSKFTPAPADERRGGFGFSGGSDREPPQRGSAFVPSPTTETGRPGFGDRRVSEAPPPSQADTASTWRSARPTPPSRNGSASPADSPIQRRKLELSARSVSSTLNEAAPSSASSNKPSPFGAAKPIDSADREKAIEERLAKEREERTEKLEAEKAEKEKARLAQEEARKAAKANAPNPFGAAKPVDTLTKELEVDARLAKERQERKEKLQKEREAGGSAPGSKEGRSGRSGPPPSLRRGSTRSSSNPSSKPTSPGPASPKANGTAKLDLGAASTADSSPAVDTAATSPATSSPTGAGPKSPALAQSSLRKEGISFASLAGGRKPSSGPPSKSPMTEAPSTGAGKVDEVGKKVEGLGLSDAQ